MVRTAVAFAAFLFTAGACRAEDRCVEPLNMVAQALKGALQDPAVNIYNARKFASSGKETFTKLADIASKCACLSALKPAYDLIAMSSEETTDDILALDRYKNRLMRNLLQVKQSFDGCLVIRKSQE